MTMIKIRALYDSALHGCGIPVGTGGEELPPVDLSEIVQFGKCRLYNDNRQWTVAELRSGERVYVLMRDQDKATEKMLTKRLKGIWAGGRHAPRPIAWYWESQGPRKWWTDD